MSERDERRKLNEEMIAWRHARFSELEADPSPDGPNMQDPLPHPDRVDDGQKHERFSRAWKRLVDAGMEDQALDTWYGNGNTRESMEVAVRRVVLLAERKIPNG